MSGQQQTFARSLQKEKEREGLVIGMSITALVHLGLIAALVSSTGDQGCGSSSNAASEDPFARAETIEAALAFKEVKPKNKQPVKKKKKKYRKVEEGISTDPKAKPIKKKDEPKHKVKVTDDEIDPTSILNKNRTQDQDLSSTGEDKIPVEGSANGSEWGTERDAKGDPYVGELRGRIESVWELPSLVEDSGRVRGCVKLNAKGKIIDSKIKRFSKNSDLNRSVKLALRKAPPMDKPVPGHLIELLTVRGICLDFKPQNE